MSKIEQPKIPISINVPTLYKITKLGSVDNPFHKDSTFGESQPFHLGWFTEAPEVGYRFWLRPYSLEPGERGIDTSPVTKIVDEKTFHTLNSIYQYEPYEK